MPTWLLGRIKIRLNEGHQIGNRLTEERACDLLDLEISRHGRHEVQPSRTARIRIGVRLKHRFVAGSCPDKLLQDFGLFAFDLFNDGHRIRNGCGKRGPEVMRGDPSNLPGVIGTSVSDPEPDRLRALNKDEATATAKTFGLALDLNAMSLFRDLTANNKEFRHRRALVLAASAKVDNHFSGPEVEERGWLRSLDDSDLRSAFTIEFDGHQG